MFTFRDRKFEFELSVYFERNVYHFKILNNEKFSVENTDKVNFLIFD